MSSAWSIATLLLCVASAATGHRVQRPGCERAESYMTRVFERDSFLASLTEAEVKCVWAGVNLYGFVTANTTSPYLLRAFYEWLLDNQLTPHRWWM